MAPEVSMRAIGGVYSIEVGARIYVGATKNIRTRWADHIATLLGHTHDNHEMQAAFNGLGISAFRFKILELVSNRSDLGNREQFWLDHYRAMPRYRIFNTSPNARLVGAYAPKRMKGVTKSAEHRAKIAAAQAAAWAKDDGRRRAALVQQNKTRVWDN
jgi:group I intron endonuclease